MAPSALFTTHVAVLELELAHATAATLITCITAPNRHVGRYNDHGRTEVSSEKTFSLLERRIWCADHPPDASRSRPSRSSASTLRCGCPSALHQSTHGPGKSSVQYPRRAGTHAHTSRLHHGVLAFWTRKARVKYPWHLCGVKA
ncbi:uncharacterized protein C8Q71DRAFT_552719 [Rhodofomes roseus]|uniref:Secreted protein n=1 Tax=Rhodofomes roseus TaxID=34475 RepID=A0ABQ8KI21_9APHY|nr:uncharacterized protein C8Q71DRAFT_552719 [Rhodofomes roseus]KAH9837604.1 hypothetical protein C8Q71DRAFT_552719 [Rhodofomes roseus]